MNSEELRDLVISALEDQKAKDIVALAVGEMTSVTDYMVIASGTSNRHVKSLAGNVVQEAKSRGVSNLGVEGEKVADWVLVDLGDVIVHVMLPDTRSFYDLERLWSLSTRESDVQSESEPE